MYILGAGFAYPATVISNAFLAELSPEQPALYIEDQTGIKSRFSVLRADYLRETGNVDPTKALQGSSESATDLGVRAVEMALSKAGVDREKIGLIIAESSTPIEALPAEAQRIACRLGLKVSSYDVNPSAASLCLILELLQGWSDERIPDYVLVVSSSAATQRINYRTGSERWYFGDAASAVVVSPRIPGKLKVKDAHYRSDIKRTSLLTIDIYGHMKMLPELNEQVGAADEAMFQRAKGTASSSQISLRSIGAVYDQNMLSQVRTKRGLPVDSTWYSFDRTGNTMGATPGCIIAERWERIVPNETVICTQAGAGFSYGYAVLEGV